MSEVARDAPAGLAAFASDLYHCADCGYCVDAVWAERGINHVCPTISHHQPIASYSGRGYIAAARAWYEGADIDEDALAARVFACTGCGNCEQVCPIGLRPAQIGQLLRETLVTRGHAPASVEQLRVTMRAHGNPQAMPAAARGGWAEGLEFVDAGATVLYAPGCAAAFNAPAEAAAAVALLALAGEQVAWRGDADRCCGAPQQRSASPRQATCSPASASSATAAAASAGALNAAAQPGAYSTVAPASTNSSPSAHPPRAAAGIACGLPCARIVTRSCSTLAGA